MSAPGTQPAATRPRRDEELELDVEDLAYGGRGLARRNGFVVFVQGGLPGDRVRARVTKAKRRFAEAEALEIVRPSADRIPPRCDHGGQPCPGAPWQELPYELQLEHKQRQVADALERIGGFADPAPEPIEPAVERWRYRNKFEYAFGEREGEVVLGFHARGRWDVVVDAEDCLLASERSNAERNRVRHWARVEGIPAYDRRTEEGVLRNLVVREGRRTGQLQTRLVTSAASFARPPVDLHTVIEGPSGGTLGPTGVLGRERLTERVCGLELEVSPTAFLQTNTEMAERLYETAASFADLTGSERVFDLFCGIGTISLVLARDAGEVWGVEVVPEAVADAEASAVRNRAENARFRAADARLGIRPLLDEAGQPDVVVVDPPRSGVSNKVIRRVVECNARRIVYVSCNPTTLAPNAAALGDAGYTLRRVKPVDMFPHTHHIECVALLERPAPDAKRRSRSQ